MSVYNLRQEVGRHVFSVVYVHSGPGRVMVGI